MKNFYACLCFLLPFLAVAQEDYLPFPRQNVEWTVLHEQISMYEPKFLHNYHYVPDGDTLINGLEFTRLYVNDGKFFDRANATYTGAYRNSGSQVLFVAKDSTQASVLYDFAIQPGWILSAVDNDTTYYFELGDIDSVTLGDDVVRRRYNFYLKSKFEEEPGRYHHSWIEGIGSTIGFFPDPRIFYMELLPVDPTFAHWLLCYQEGSALLYSDSNYYNGACYRMGLINSVKGKTQEQYYKIYPNPASDYFLVETEGNTEEKNQTLRLLDQYGRIVLQQSYQKEVQQRFDISNLATGVFFLEIVDEENQVNHRQRFIRLRK